MIRNRIFIISLIIILFFSMNFSLTKQYDFYKAYGLYKKGEYLKALKIYSRYKKRLSDSPDYLYDLGTIYLKMRQYKIALKYFNTAIIKKPSENILFKTYFNMGVTYYRTGDIKKSVSFFKKSAIIKPENMILKKNMELLLKNMRKQSKSRKKPREDKKTREKRISEPLLNYINETEKESIKSFLKHKKEKREEKYW